MDPLQAAGQAQNYHSVDVTSLAQQLMQELAAAESSALLRSRGGVAPIVISEVGSLTREVAPAEYEPQHVSIGPYSRIKQPGLARDDEKIRSLGAVLSARCATGATLQLFLDELARHEEQARSYYEHSFDVYSSEDFVRMLLLDACYLLVRFGGVGAAASNGQVQGGYQLGSAPLVSTSYGGSSNKLAEPVAVVRDVFYLAENQIPFFVVEKIVQLIDMDIAIPVVRTYVRDLLGRYSVATPPPWPEPGNLLHLLHMHFTPTVPFLSPPTDGKVTGERVGRWRTATEYYYFAGVKFKGRQLLGRPEGPRCILDVKLNRSHGVLEVPRLNIDAETWRLLRNLMALEQRNPEVTRSHVTAYCVFMSQLACTPVDVELLCRCGVIAHGLGNNGEVASFFADLCKGIVFSVDDRRRNYLWATCLALDKRFRSRHRRWMVWLRQKYFRNPWLAVGLAAAAVGLVCTVVQAVYSVLSYKQGA